MAGNYDPATMARAREFARTTEAVTSPTNIFTVSNVATKTDMKNVNFPVKMGTSDPEDKKFALMQKLVNNNGVVPGVGQNVVGSEFFDYMQRKMDVTQQVAFKEFLMKQVDWSRPESQEYWVNMFPWMLEERLAEINRVCELQKHKARIEVAGPSTPEDWQFLYLEQTGNIVVPNVPVHELPKAAVAGSRYNDPEKGYERGMFSPMVNYIPPFKTGSTQNHPGYQPVNHVTWDNPTGAGTPPTGGTLSMPNNLPAFIPFPRNTFAQ
jgi:hypothetical protein